MTYIILCILMNVLVYVNFKLFDSFKINTVQAIIFNYFFCMLAGLLFIDGISFISVISGEPVFIAAILGIIFIVNFYIISRTTENYGISVASIATKLSLIIPVLASLLLFKSQFKDFSLLNYIGISLAFPAMILGSIKKDEQINRKAILGFSLPLMTFLLSGTIDTAINAANFWFLDADTEGSFIIIIFGCSSIIGLAYLLYRKEKIKARNIMAGLVLGMPNYFALFFLIRSLSAFDNDGSLVYPSVNIGVIILASFLSVIFFRDKLSLKNKAGILLSVIAIFLIYHQELLGYLNK